MRTEAEIRAELAKVEQALGTDKRMTVGRVSALVSRADTLRWVLGEESVLGGALL